MDITKGRWACYLSILSIHAKIISGMSVFSNFFLKNECLLIHFFSYILINILFTC